MPAPMVEIEGQVNQNVMRRLSIHQWPNIAEPSSTDTRTQTEIGPLNTRIK